MRHATTTTDAAPSAAPADHSSSRPPRAPKVLGADVELGNFILGVEEPGGSGFAASRALLREIPGASAGESELPGSDPQNIGRRFLWTNGGCAYIDLDHLELALPETRSAFDHVAYWRAMVSDARVALARTNCRQPPGRRVQALANCSDGLDHSYGAHVNVCLTRAAWENIVRRKPHHLASLAAFQVSSIVFTGQGKVGSENGRPPVDFQISQRADFVETLVGSQTTFNRPIVNSRDEPLCGGRSPSPATDAEPALARLHVIFFDSTLCDTASLLRVGTLQIVVAMLEAGRVDPGIALDDPLEALERWSHDPGLTATAATVCGDDVTAVDLQFRFLDAAKAFAAGGGCDGIVPRAAEILALWEDTLLKLRARDFAALSRRLDWVLKRHILERVIARRTDLTWASPEIKHLDQLYASIDEADGLFWACERTGLVDRLVSDDAVTIARGNPPEDTRAWTRAHLLRAAGAHRIDSVDWDSVRLTVRVGRGWLEQRTIRLPCPFGSTRMQHAHLFDGDLTLEDIVDALEPKVIASPGDRASVDAPERRASLAAPPRSASLQAGNCGWTTH